ncbi:MarR family winged helix-turn-helix transcriptional regulator [Microbacterium sp. Marseille-Q6965]|uniref:MarR family winged helix-turn-helix transcriptional regulator n=1 Tax=Microbacterium sp. Marseille-Q6965 TaxID=2965072 RepID=UPI0021B84851|nr:MarR family transcriptional regulator [Microbacterium sp. Marseille-Q6965]
MAQTTLGAVIDDLSFLLARANAVSLEAASAALRPFGLKPRSYSVLALALSDHRPSQREIAEYLRLDPSQVVALVDDLQSRGLVERETDPTDRRAKVVTATVEGARLFATAGAHVRQAERDVFGALDDAERAMLRKLIDRVAFPG